MSELSKTLRTMGSREWYTAFRRFSFGFNFEVAEIDPVTMAREHHKGWRAGVLSLKKGRSPPYAPPRLQEGPLRRAYEHGAVAGRKAAKEYLKKSGKDREALT